MHFGTGTFLGGAGFDHLVSDMAPQLEDLCITDASGGHARGLFGCISVDDFSPAEPAAIDRVVGGLDWLTELGDCIRRWHCVLEQHADNDISCYRHALEDYVSRLRPMARRLP